MKNLTFAAVCAAVLLAGSPAMAQKSKSTIRTAFSSPIEGLDWHQSPGNEIHFSAHAIFDTLVAVDEKTGKMVPLLAKSFKRVDNRTLDFTLRDDVKWHDGEAFDADDVVSTIKYLTSPKTRIRFKRFYRWIAKVEKTGSHSVRLTAKKPTASDLATLAFVLWIYPEHAHGRLAKKVDFKWKPVGTGPYRPTQASSRVVNLTQNPAYKHGGSVKPATSVKHIEIRHVPDAGTQIADMLTGRIDYIRSTVDEGKKLAAKPQFRMTVKQGISLVYMAIDAKGRSGNKPLTDVRVRRALQMGVNRKDLILLNTGDANFPRIPNAMCWDGQTGCSYTDKPPAYDPAGAKKLLAEAGYPGGFDVEITTFSANAASRNSAELVAGQLTKIGVRAKIDARTITSYRKKMRDGKIQLCVCPYGGGGFLSDITGMINFIYSAPKSRDYHGDATLKKLSRATNAIMDPIRRKEAARKAFDRAHQQAYFMPLSPSPAIIIHSKDVKFVQEGLTTPYGLAPNQVRWK